MSITWTTEVSKTLNVTESQLSKEDTFHTTITISFALLRIGYLFQCKHNNTAAKCKEQ